MLVLSFATDIALMPTYLIFAITMAGIVILALVVTGNLAATFNERAKRDLRAALEPLAAQLEGSIDLDEALVSGRYQGQITTGQVISGPGGMGRLFRTTYIEPTGGLAWKALVQRPRDEALEWERSFESQHATPDGVRTHAFELLDALLPYPGWFELTYDPEAGSLSLTRAMQSRRDVPTRERFALYLQTLESIAEKNRAVQGEGAGAIAAS